ncbi:MAG TPA: ATP-binding cassette domain-containing protein [Vicinamibacterales bacterium]|nr:ATP-binding cassette domain-containing protein [Vicinamibacterales bacterium]
MTVLEIADVSKRYGALRPLRLAQLAVAAGESVAIVGLEHGAAEILVNLITGATLPDSGEVRLFGRATAAIADSTDWLATVDRFGIVSDRAVLLDQLSVVQNLAMPFTLDVEPPPDAVRQRAEALAREVGLAAAIGQAAVASIDALARTRVRLGRAIALDPQILVLEHATAALGREAAQAFGRDVRAIAARRGAAVIAATADERFAGAVAARVLVHDPATGELRERRRGWFSR